MSTQAAENAFEEYRVDKPAHVPDEAVVEMNYRTFGGSGDAGFAALGDYHLAWKDLQDADGPPLRWTPLNGGHWIATTAETVAEVLDNADRFSSRYLILPKEVASVYKFVPLSLDPPEHRPYRSVLNPLFSHKVVREKEPGARALAIELIEGFRENGGCEFVSEFANIFPVSIFHQLVGLPEEERERLRVMATFNSGVNSADAVADGIARIEEFLGPILKERRENPGDDLFSGLLQSKVDGRPLTDEEAMMMCSQLFVAGFHTTAGTLSFIMRYLAENPEMRDELRADPKKLPVKLDELVRRFPVVCIPRVATRDTELGGMRVLEGDPVYVPLVLYNFDDAVFDHSMEVDFSRRGELHSAFGRGVHRCPGSVLALIEITVVLQEWLARIPDFWIDPDDKLLTKGGSVAGFDRLSLRWSTD